MPTAAAEIAGCLQNSGLKFVGGGRGIFLEHAQEAFISEFFVVSVGRLGDAIGVENDAVAGFQMGRAQGEGLVREDAEDAAAFGQAEVRTVPVQHDGWIVTSVDVLQHARCTIEVGVEKGRCV